MRRIVFILPLLAVAAIFAADPPKDILPPTLSINDIPLGLGSRPVLKDNPITAAKVALGRRLFFDPILSADRTIACASCHRPDHGFTSPEGRPRGIDGQQIDRRAPTLFNRAYGTSYFWDGRVATLEEQAI